MPNDQTINPLDAFTRMSATTPEAPIIDVRSPGEFAAAHFAGTVNLPILCDDHRHQVGLTYKEEGADQAQALGHELVSGTYREELIQAWCDELQKSEEPAMLFCWRGGLRSQISQQWISHQGLEVLRVEGGYKALRGIALETIARKRNFIILGGPTGSGKTELLKKIPQHVDLEGLANHRGSVFGLRIDNQQPTQAVFENNLSKALFRIKDSPLLEDESRLIGKRHLTEDFYGQMSIAPMVLLTEDRQNRAQHIFEEYILEQAEFNSLKEIGDHYKNCVNRIRKTLGHQKADECIKIMDQAFTSQEKSDHIEWISLLLESYYDRLYAYSLSKKNRQLLHQGDSQSCLEFLQHHFEKNP